MTPRIRIRSIGFSQIDEVYVYAKRAAMCCTLCVVVGVERWEVVGGFMKIMLIWWGYLINVNIKFFINFFLNLFFKGWVKFKISIDNVYIFCYFIRFNSFIYHIAIV